MKKQVKKILAMFLVVMLFLFEIGSISVGATSNSVQVDSTGYTTTTWDFSDAAQLEEDFNGPWKRNNDGKDFAVNGGYLYGATSTASDVRRVVLKKEYDVKTVSVDIVPVEGVYCGGIMLGITGEKSGGSTANPSIMVEVDDPNNTATVCTLRVRGYALNESNKIAETVISEINMTEGLSSGKEAQAVNLKVEISGTNLVITVTPLSGTITPYQCEVDITKDKNNNTTVFTSESLQGKVGLVARATATKLDNFYFDYDLSDTAKLTIGGINNSTITVPENRSLPTGPNVVDGKYILDWTMTTKNGDNKVAEYVVDTYYGKSCGNLTYTYKANVVDPAMLAVCSQEGASEKGEGYYDVRFMASLNAFDYEDYECAGFVLSKKDGTALVAGAEGYLTVETTKLYTGLYADEELISPADLDTYKGSNDYSTYFIAHVITGIPNNSTIYVRAYVKLANGDIVYGQTQTVEVPYTAQ